MIKKVLLLGGTGAIGTYLADILDENNIEVYITSRSNHKDSENVHFFHTDAKQNVNLSKILKTHWDAIVDFFSYKTEEFANRLSLLINATDQYVFLSSARVFANEEHPIKEDSPRLLDVSKDTRYLSTDEYALTKARQEDLLKELKIRNWTIVRPYITYGDKRIQLGVLEKEEWLYRALHGRTVVFTKGIAERITSLANGYDVALGIYSLLGREEAQGNMFNIATPERHTWEDILNIYKKIIKSRLHIDLKVKYVSVDDFISCRGKGLEYQVIYDRLYDRDFDITKESAYINTNQFVKVEVGLDRCLTNFINSGCPFKSISWYHEAIKDRITKERTPLSEISGIKSKIKYLTKRYL